MAGQYFDAEPEEEDDELLLLELLEELLLEDELDELLVLLEEALLEEDDEELLELEALPVLPPQPISKRALIDARQIPRRVRTVSIDVSSGFIYELFMCCVGHPNPARRPQQDCKPDRTEKLWANVKHTSFW